MLLAASYETIERIELSPELAPQLFDLGRVRDSARHALREGVNTTMPNNCSLLGGAAYAAALGIFLTGSISFAQAQSAVQATSSSVAATQSAGLDLATPAASYSSSSTSDNSTEALADARLSLSSEGMDGMQPPPRRRYGRPNYSDSHTNPDGSSKFAFLAGAGAAIPTQNTGSYLTPSWNFQVGAGRNWNKNFGVLVQFDYAHFGLQGPVLYNQLNLYNSDCITTSAGSDCLSSLDGNNHIWSFTLNPTFTIRGSDSSKTGAYVVAGVGFYHKVTNFTTPTVGDYCDFYYGCYEYQVNEVIDHYTSNAPGFNGGFGLTYKLSHFASERLYMEARYVFVANSSRAGYNPTTNPNSNNFFPPNANHTFYIPVTVGLRF